VRRGVLKFIQECGLALCAHPLRRSERECVLKREVERERDKETKCAKEGERDVEYV
jgi:hypothetical protein